MSAELLTEGQWGLLAGAERELHTRAGESLGITDVVSRDESAPQAAMWGEAYSNAEALLADLDETGLQLECARRVAAAQAILAFGVPE